MIKEDVKTLTEENKLTEEEEKKVTGGTYGDENKYGFKELVHDPSPLKGTKGGNG